MSESLLKELVKEFDKKLGPAFLNPDTEFKLNVLLQDTELQLMFVNKRKPSIARRNFLKQRRRVIMRLLQTREWENGT